MNYDFYVSEKHTMYMKNKFLTLFKDLHYVQNSEFRIQSSEFRIQSLVIIMSHVVCLCVCLCNLSILIISLDVIIHFVSSSVL